MRIRLKLSVSHDMDLISLSQCNFPMIEWIKICLKSYVEEGQISTIPLPAPPQTIRCDKLSLNFSLNDSKDQAVINWLNQIRPGQRTGAIKSIFRCSLSAPCLFGHYDEHRSVTPVKPKRTPEFIPSFHQAISPTMETSKPAAITAHSSFSGSNSDVCLDDDDFDILDFDPEGF